LAHTAFSCRRLKAEPPLVPPTLIVAELLRPCRHELDVEPEASIAGYLFPGGHDADQLQGLRLVRALAEAGKLDQAEGALLDVTLEGIHPPHGALVRSIRAEPRIQPVLPVGAPIS
jgi:hypothetical protein